MSRVRPSFAAFVLLGLLATVLAGGARAAVVPVPGNEVGAAAFGGAISAQPGLVAAASFIAVPTNGTPNAVSDTLLAGFPTHGPSFGVLSTGNAQLADDANVAGDSDADNDGDGVRGDTDVDTVILRLELDVPSTANCLAFNFAFLTEEYPEYIGHEFNDSFVAELDALTWYTQETWLASSSNFAVDGLGRAISVNADSVTPGAASGTTYDGATGTIVAATPVTPGLHVLYLSIFDQVDPYYDSAVFVDNLRTLYTASGQCRGGMSFPPETLLPVCDGASVTILGTPGNDTLIGGPGDDVIMGLGGDDTIDGRGGNDRVCGGVGFDTLAGGPGNDLLVGGDGAGKDTITYAASDASVSVNLGAGTAAGEGNDTLRGIENVTGSAYGDVLIGDGNANVIRGLPGDDQLLGAAGDDQLFGGIGNDFLRGAAGNDALTGGDGNDTADYSTLPGTNGVVVNLGAGTATGWGADSLTAVENVDGSPNADLLIGDGAANLLRGLFGNDELRGALGADRLFGGVGDDVLRGAGGDDQLTGGIGTDTVDYATSPAPVIVDLLGGTASGWGNDTISAVERVLGSPSADWISGSTGDDFLFGNEGDDSIDGRAGTDVCEQGTGAGPVVNCEG